MRIGGWLQGDRGGLSFEAKTSQKLFEKRGGVGHCPQLAPSSAKQHGLQ